MIRLGTRSDGERRRRAAPAMGAIFHKSEWMESGDDPTLSPTVSLIEQPPNTNFIPHFHRQNQFQVFVEGAGTIGRREISPVTIQHAAAYTGYGPLISGPQGLEYFTLRPVCESGFFAVAERVEEMLPGPDRHAQSEPIRHAAGELMQWEQLFVTADETLPLLTAGDGGAQVVSLFTPRKASAYLANDEH